MLNREHCGRFVSDLVAKFVARFVRKKGMAGGLFECIHICFEIVCVWDACVDGGFAAEVGQMEFRSLFADIRCM